MLKDIHEDGVWNWNRLATHVPTIYRLKAASLLLNGDIDDEIVRVLLKGESMIV